MERRLMVMRHAKSSWEQDAMSDHARPLNKRGKNDAPRVAARLVELGWLPEWVVSSDSRRTRETWERMADRFERPVVTFTPSLYEGGLGEIRDEVSLVPASTRTVLVLGHNPGFEEAVSELARIEVHLTTANVALLVGSGDTWKEALGGRWRLETLVRPKELPD